MEKTTLEKEFHKPYVRLIVIGVILTILFNILSNFDLFSKSNLDSEKIFLLCSLFSAIFLVSFPFFKMLSNSELKAIKKVQDELALTDEMVLTEYTTADRLGKLCIANNFTFTKELLGTKVIPNRDIVWIFETIQIKGGKKHKFLTIRTINKKEYKIQVYQDKNLNAIYRNYSYYKHILIGYDKDLDKLYKNHFDEFLNEQYYKED